MHRIDGPGATVDNKFTDGDPVGGIQATVVTDDFLNDVQEELMSVLSAAGVLPVKGTQNQLLKAISVLAQTQKATAYTAGGTSPAFTLTPSPALTAYAPNQGFRVLFGAAGGANPTINISGLGPINLKQYNGSGTKVSAVIYAGQISDIAADGTDFVLLDQIPVSTALSHGQCKLAKVGANIVLSPLNGNKLLIAGVSQSIPSAGVSLAATGLTVSGLYYIYAYMASGVMTLEASTTGHSADAATGVEIKAGDATRTLVGMARPIAGPAFQDTAAQRFLLSYFNRVDITASAPLTSNASTSSATYVELSSAFRCEYLSWGNEQVKMLFEGSLTSTAAVTSLMYIAISLDSSALQDGALICSTISSGVTIPGTSTGQPFVAEGYHYTAIFAKTNNGSQTVICLGAASAPDRCLLSTTIRG